MNLRSITEAQLDQLREICNIGAGHAAGSLAKLLHENIMRINVPSIRVVSLPEMPDLVGGAEGFVGAASFNIQGDIQGSFLVLFEEGSTRMLISTMLHKKPEEIQFEDSLSVSALAEAGNILASSFVAALSNLTKLNLIISTPSTAFDMAGAVLDPILGEIGREGDDVLFLEVHMEADNMKLMGKLFIIPDPSTIETLTL